MLKYKEPVVNCVCYCHKCGLTGRTKKLGIILKTLGIVSLPILLLLWPVVAAVGSILVGLGYGVGQPMVATFEAVGDDREYKLYHAFVVRSF